MKIYKSFIIENNLRSFKIIIESENSLMLLQKIEKKKLYHMGLKMKEALRYTQQNSVVDGEETDFQFLKDVNDVSDKKKSTLGQLSLIDDQNHIITKQQCDQIEQIAILHKQANIFNNTSMLFQDQIQPNSFCQCGCGRGKGQYFPLCMDQQKMAFLGPGVLLIFFYIKQIRWTLLFMLMTYCLYSISSSIILTDFSEDSAACEGFGGLNFYLCMLTEISSFKNKLEHSQYVQINLWIGFFASIIWTFGVRYIKVIGIKKQQQIDQMLDSSSDYTIQIDYLPVKSYHENELIQYIQELWETKQLRKPNLQTSNEQLSKNQLKLKSILLIYNMEGFRKMTSQILALSYQITELFQDHLTLRASQMKQPLKLPNNNKREGTIIDETESQNKFSILQSIRHRKVYSRKNIPHEFSNKIKPQKVQQYADLKNKLIKKYEELIQFRQKFLKDQNFRKQLSTTCALIQFQSDKQQKQFLKHFASDVHKNLIQSYFCENKQLVFKNAEIKIRRAAQPSDMNWLNCEKQFSYLRYFFLLLMTFLILTISYTSIHFLRTSNLFNSSSMYLTVLVIQLFNRIIWNSLQFLVGYEYNNSKTQAIISLMKKSIIAQVINIIVSPLIFNFFVNNNKIYEFKGLSGVVVIFQFLMFFTMFLFYILNPNYYTKKILLYFKKSRNIIIRNLCQVIGEIDTVEQIKPVLRQYEGPEFPIAGGYVYVTTSIFHTLFYCHLQPVVIPIVIINILGFLATMKYLLLRRSKIPQLTNIQIFDFALFAVGCGAAFYGAGSLYFMIISKYCLSIDFPSRYFIPSILSIVIWFIISLNPFDITSKITNFIVELVGQKDRATQDKTNQEMQDSATQMKKSKQLKQAQDLIAKMFITNNASFYKAERKQSYYQYSNVKKLLNFQSQLKEVVSNDSENNNILAFCQSFFKNRQKKHFTQEKQSLKQLKLMTTLAQHESQIINQQLKEYKDRSGSPKSPSYLIVNRISRKGEGEASKQTSMDQIQINTSNESTKKFKLNNKISFQSTSIISKISKE